jgi:formate dehydrogenase subunit gamma
MTVAPANPSVDLDTVSAIIAARQAMPGALLPILHEIQDRIGYIPATAVPQIATALQLSRAEVHGVISFYPHFRQEPPGRHVLRICCAEACQAVGGDALMRHAQARLGCGAHETTADGGITLEPVFCLGQCGVGPALLVDDRDVHGRVSAASFDALSDSLRGAE